MTASLEIVNSPAVDCYCLGSREDNVSVGHKKGGSGSNESNIIHIHHQSCIKEWLARVYELFCEYDARF